jgi:hypothetical protein
MNLHEDNLAHRQENPTEEHRAEVPNGGQAGLFVPFDRWNAQAADLRRRFLSAEPFPHVVLDDFLTPDAARQAVEAFPPPGNGWIHYLHYNERTLGLNDRRRLPDVTEAILDELNSDAFVSLLGKITGIASLCSDPSMEGGGLHLSERGGFLNLHSDFNVHPRHPDWRRRLNLVVFLNPHWEESWGGHLELWDADVRRCVHRIAPIHNRAVLFRSGAASFHGYPHPITCPSEVTRKSFALYYFSSESSHMRAVSTEYRGRPGDGMRRIPIYLDKMALRFYDRAKRTFGFDDTFVSGLLRRTLGRSGRAN